MNIATGLLFLEGYIADPGLATALSSPEQAPNDSHVVGGGSADVASTVIPGPRRALPAATKRPAMNLFQSLMFLGGRPMTAGHNDDIDEPFPRTYGNRVATRQWLAHMHRHIRSDAGHVPASSTQHCTQC